MDYQLPKTVGTLSAKSAEIIDSLPYKDFQQTLTPVNFRPANLIYRYFRQIENSYSFNDRFLDLAGFSEFLKLKKNGIADLALRLFLMFILDNLHRQNNGNRRVNLPLLSESERIIAIDWFSKSTSLKSQDVYDLLGNAGIYSEIHRRNTCSIPVGFEPSFRKALEIKNNVLPFQFVSTETFSPDAKWISNDRVRREQITSEVVSFAKAWSKNNGDKKAIILDIAGGNGELSHLVVSNKDFPPNIMVVIRELNEGMIAEGKKKIHDLGLSDRVCFIQGDASIPFDSVRNKLPKGFDQSPVIVAVSSYTQGAMPTSVAEKVLFQMYEDLCVGGLLINVDFSSVPADLVLKKEFQEQTGDSGTAFLKTRNYLELGLSTCYGNWQHNTNNLNRSSKFIEHAFGITLQNQWKVTLFTSIPVWIGKKKMLVINIPGFVERVVKVIKELVIGNS